MTLEITTNHLDVINTSVNTKYEYYISNLELITSSIMRVHVKPFSSKFIDYGVGQYCKWKGHDGKWRSFSIVNSPNQQNRIEFHIRVSTKNQCVLNNLYSGKKVILSGPYGKTGTFFSINKPNLLIAEGIGIVAFNSLIESLNKFYLPSAFFWLGQHKDLKYFNEIVYKWRVIDNLIIKNVGCEYASLLNSCIEYKDKIESLNCYFAGSSRLKHFIIDNFFIKLSDGSQFFSDI